MDFSVKSDAQISYHLPESPLLNAPASLRLPVSPPGSFIKFPGINGDLQQQRILQPVASNAMIQHMPFFCRQELKAEKRFGVPLRLRVGSVQYTDWLEQKPGAVAP